MIRMMIADHLKKVIFLFFAEIVFFSFLIFTDYLQINEPIPISSNVQIEDTISFDFSVDEIYPDLLYQKGTWIILKKDLTLSQRKMLLQTVQGNEVDNQEKGKNLIVFYLMIVQILSVFVIQNDVIYDSSKIPVATLLLSLIHDGMVMIFIMFVLFAIQLFDLNYMKEGLSVARIVLFTQYSLSLKSLLKGEYFLDYLLLKMLVLLMSYLKRHSDLWTISFGGVLCFLYYFFSLGVLSAHYEVLFPFLPFVSLAYQLVFSLSIKEKVFCLFLHLLLILIISKKR